MHVWFLCKVLSALGKQGVMIVVFVRPAAGAAASSIQVHV